MADKDEIKGGRKGRRNRNVVSFWLNETDYELLTRAALAHGGDRKAAFVDLLHKRYRPSFPILSALSHVVATSLALEQDGVDDAQIAKLRREVDHLARLAIAEVRATPDLTE